MISQITNRIFIGDANDGKDISMLKSLGINCVMNATLETDNLSGNPEFKYIRLDQNDGVPIPKETLDKFMTWMREIMVNEKNKVLIHCGAGVSRAPSFTITWLITTGFGWDEAEALVRAKRDIINPNPILKQSIMEYFEIGGDSK